LFPVADQEKQIRDKNNCLPKRFIFVLTIPVLALGRGEFFDFLINTSRFGIISILPVEVAECVERMTLMGSSLNRTATGGLDRAATGDCPYHLGHVSIGRG
jgi:hypothetical protein